MSLKHLAIINGHDFSEMIKNPLGPAEKEAENGEERCNCCLKKFFIIRVQIIVP